MFGGHADVASEVTWHDDDMAFSLLFLCCTSLSVAESGIGIELFSTHKIGGGHVGFHV